MCALMKMCGFLLIFTFLWKIYFSLILYVFDLNEEKRSCKVLWDFGYHRLLQTITDDCIHTLRVVILFSIEFAYFYFVVWYCFKFMKKLFENSLTGYQNISIDIYNSIIIIYSGPNNKVEHFRWFDVIVPEI